ncbi:MAG: type II toxin-antitoxin system VapC family toxin [Anaerolineales bacterium]
MGRVSELTGQRIYLDTNIFIYALEGYPEFAPMLAELFEAIDRGEVLAVTSELTLAETLVKPFIDASAERQQAYQQFLQSSHGLTLVPISRAVLIEAARLRAAHSFRLPDAIHLATARLTQCATFLSNDKRLSAAGLAAVTLAELI